MPDDDMSGGAASVQPDPHDPPWLLSLVDGRVHAWVSRDFLTQAWEARCGYLTPESQIAPDNDEPKCVDCQLAHESRLATRFEGLAERMHAQTVRELAAEADAIDATEPDTSTDDPEPTCGTGELAGFLRSIEDRYAVVR